MWIRFVFGVGGIVLFAMSPVLGGMLYRFWRWLGVITEIGFAGATIISVFLGVVAIIFVVMAFDGSVPKAWAREWVDQK